MILMDQSVLQELAKVAATKMKVIISNLWICTGRMSPLYYIGIYLYGY